MPSGHVRLDLKKPWRVPSPAAGIVSVRKDHYTFRADRARLVAPYLAKVAPGLARRIAGVAAIDIDPIKDMAAADEPKLVQHPIGKAVLADIAEALRLRAPVKLALYPYQTVGAAFLKMLGYRGILADEQGLGKTATALAAIIADPQELLPAAVVAPAIVFTNWQDEIRRWLPAVPIYPMISRNTPPPPRGFRGIIVTKYSTVVGQTDAILHVKPRYLIVDEAHRIKNPQAQQTEAVTELAANIPHVVLLSGTPLKNNVVELWNLLNTIDPALYGNEGEFTESFATTEDSGSYRGPRKKITGAKNTELLRERLAGLMIRRLKAQVAKFLPDKTRQYVTVDPNPKAMREYIKAEKDFATWVEKTLKARVKAAIAEAEDRGEALTAEEKAEERRAARDAAARAVHNEALVKVGYLRKLVGRMKIEAAVEMALEFVENGQPLIMFAYHGDVIDALAEALDDAGVRVGVIDGGVPAGQRGKIVKAFQDGDLDVILGSEAMKEGITLHRASNVLFVERFWTSADEEQAEDRAHRVGQKNAVMITFLVILKTIDERMRDIIDIKRKLIAATVGGANVTEGASTLSMLLGTFSKTMPQAKPVKAPRAKKVRTVLREDVVALVFAENWTAAAARQWSTVNGFAGKLDRMGKHHVLRLRAVRGRTKTVRAADGVTAVIQAG